LLRSLYKKQKISRGPWNFGPGNNNNKSVYEIINIINSKFNNKIKIIKKPILSKKHHESSILKLNSTNANKFLKWKAKYNIETSLQLTSDWYKKFLNGENVLKICREQILNYFNYKKNK
jgi:CDP-glucose 4,6-dehydratase